MREKPNNTYDPGLIIKEVGDFDGQFIRVSDSRSVADQYYTHFNAVYNSQNQPTKVTYYKGTKAHKTSIATLDDVSSNLNNKYLFIHSAPSDQKYHIWFNVNNAGTNPAPANSLPIEVDINANDNSAIVAVAITLTINTLFKDKFKAQRNGNVVEIANIKEGVITNSEDFNTDFNVSNDLGQQVVTSEIDITYDGFDPVYNGQILKDYQYNIYTGKFELSKKQDSKETLKVDEVNSNLTYVGTAIAGSGTSESVWKIFRVSKSGNVTSLQYVSGDPSYSFIWDNRASLTYE